MRISDWSSDVCSSDLSVTRGRGEYVVTETGMATEIGHIANMLANTEREKTPLQTQPPDPVGIPARSASHPSRSEERRVGQESVSKSRFRWAQCDLNTKQIVNKDSKQSNIKITT